MKPKLLILVVLATTVLVPTRISAQDKPPSALKSVGVTAAEVGTGLVVSLAGEYGSALATMSFHYTLGPFYTILALTPVPTAAGVYGIGTWLDRGGSFGPTVLGGYIGATVGFAAGLAYDLGHDEDNGILLLVGFPVGCAVGSVIGYKLSRKPATEKESRWQLVPPSMGLALKRPATGRPVEIAGVKVNLVGARF